jgi:hypothetical protein
MVAPNYSHLTRRAPDPSKPHREALATRFHHYFDRHPNVSRHEFLLGGLQHETDTRQPLTVNDLRIHAWLLERQAIVDRERSGWRAKAKRWFQG